MKNYDDEYGVKINRAKSSQNEETGRLKSTKELFEKCDELIAEVNKTMSGSNKRLSLSNPQSNDNRSSDNIGKSQKLLERAQSEFSDVIGETENMEPFPKKRKLNKPDKESKPIDESASKECGSVKKTSQKNPYSCDELNDSFDEGELEKIDLIEKKTTSKIHVLANVVVEAANDEGGNDSNNEDDLFPDDDVIETTPQKKRNSVHNW